MHTKLFSPREDKIYIIKPPCNILFIIQIKCKKRRRTSNIVFTYLVYHRHEDGKKEPTPDYTTLHEPLFAGFEFTCQFQVIFRSDRRKKYLLVACDRLRKHLNKYLINMECVEFRDDNQ